MNFKKLIIAASLCVASVAVFSVIKQKQMEKTFLDVNVEALASDDGNHYHIINCWARSQGSHIGASYICQDTGDPNIITNCVEEYGSYGPPTMVYGCVSYVDDIHTGYADWLRLVNEFFGF